jgi:hypothetical protein
MSSRNDFHVGRTYGADPAEGTGPGIGFNFSLTIAWLKLQLSRLLGSGTYPSDLKDQRPDPSGTPVFPMVDFAKVRAPATKPERRGN